jgi:adenine phosphoribosyltransferase
MTVRIDDYIGKVPDFPKPGILFYDISPLLAVPDVWEDAIDQLSKLIIPFQPTLLAAIDSRGFLVASPLALKIRCGLIMIRKMGKLPGITIKQEYSLEYGEDSLEIRDGIIKPGQSVLILDDLLATGGTAEAAVKLISRVGAHVVGAAFLIELDGLGGRERLRNIPCLSLVNYSA